MGGRSPGGEHRAPDLTTRSALARATGNSFNLRRAQPHVDSQGVFDALRAVLRLHHLVEAAAHGEALCAGCGHPYPCPTVDIVSAVLAPPR